MSFPSASTLEMPILQELVAVGGAEDVRFLYERLINYFPQLSESEIHSIRKSNSATWRKFVQRAGKDLDEKGFLNRTRGIWKISEKGRREAEAESQGFVLKKDEPKEITHKEIQQMLVEIGIGLGLYAETEFEFYDVIWRESEKVSRLSHVFEVQSKGNIDSAFAKLKRAYTAQRSKIYLVIASERDLNRARKSLEREFQDIETAVVILTFAQIELVAQNLKNIAEILRDFLLK